MPYDIVVLASDFDNTMSNFNLADPNESHCLAQPIIELAEEADVFSIVTARTYASANSHILGYVSTRKFENKPLFQLACPNGEQKQANLDRLLVGILTSASNNFSRVTGLPLLCISTRDDVFFADCKKAGDAYTKYHLPYENSILVSIDHEKKTVTIPAMPEITVERKKKHAFGKWEQLSQTGLLALERFPGKKIKLIFVDDHLNTCLGAVDAFDDMPELVDVTLVIYHFTNSGELILIDQAYVEERKNPKEEKFMPPEDSAFGIKCNTIFTTTNAKSSSLALTFERLHDFPQDIKTMAEFFRDTPLEIRLSGAIEKKVIDEKFTSTELLEAYIKQHFPLNQISSLQPRF